MMRNKLWWFTLIELIISMVVVCILFVVLLSTYSRISRVWFKIEQERNVYQEILQVSQLLQTVADNNSIDFDSYKNDNKNNLIDNLWIVDVLYLSWKDGKTQIFSSWNCVGMNNIWNQISWAYCNLYMRNIYGETALFNNKNSNISKVYFKVIPFASERQYIDDESSVCEESNYLKCINKNWFWVIMSVYNWNYKKNIWELNVNVPVQWFFSLNY